MKKIKTVKLCKFIKVTALAIVLTIAGSSLNVVNVSAGSSDIVVDNTSFANELNTSKWNNANADVLIENGKLIFSKESTGDTRLITKLPATVSGRHEELFASEYRMKLTSLPEGEKFFLAYALGSVEALPEEAGNFEITFENSNGIQVGIYAYDEAGEKITVVDSTNCNLSIGREFQVTVSATSEMHLTVRVNNKTLYNEKAPVDLSGRIGFLQTGSCAAEVSLVNIVSHTYDAPENCNIVEDFESGTINVNALTSRMMNSCGYFPAGIHVKEYKDNNVLMFENANLGYFGTTHQYSNFEVTFDVPYMLHNSELREDGTVAKPANFAFAFAFGDESEDYEDYGYTSAAEAVIFRSTDLYLMKGAGVNVNFAEKNFYEKGSTDGYSVRISMIDSVLRVEMKSLTGSTFEEVLSHKIGDATPTGYIHFWSTGQANFAIDNLSIINKDEGANTIEVDYQSGIIEGTTDWEYEPMEVKYKTDSEDGFAFNWFYVPVGTAILGVIFVVVCVVIAKRKKTPKKEVTVNEKA